MLYRSDRCEAGQPGRCGFESEVIFDQAAHYRTEGLQSQFEPHLELRMLRVVHPGRGEHEIGTNSLALLPSSGSLTPRSSSDSV